MKILLLVACVALASCSAQQQAQRTGVVGPDGQIIWDEPGSTLYGESVQQPNTAQEIAQGVSDFARGYEQGAEQYPATQPQHGTMTATTITPGQLPTTTWIHY